MVKKASHTVIFLIFTVIFALGNLVWAQATIPTLISPSLGSTTQDTSPTLTWDWVGDCTTSGNCFLVQVDESDFSSPFKSYYTSSTSYSPGLELGKWYWRVKAKDTTNTWSEWSAVWDFTISQEDSQTPSPTPSPAPGDASGSVRLSEFMACPDEGDEWVELYNSSDQELDLSGYKIDDIDGGSSPFVIPPGTKISPFSYLVFSFSSKLNNSGDSVRFLTPQDNVLDSFSYSDCQEGVSFAKDENGNWQKTTQVTPNAKNVIITPASQSSSDGGNTSNSSSPTPTSKSNPTQTPKPKNSTSSGQVLSETADPSSFTLDLGDNDSNEQSIVEGERKNNKLGVVFLFLAAILLFGAAVFRFWKAKKQKVPGLFVNFAKKARFAYNPFSWKLFQNLKSKLKK